MRGGRSYEGGSRGRGKRSGRGRGRGRGDVRNHSPLRSNYRTSISPPYRHRPPRSISPILDRRGPPRSVSPIPDRRRPPRSKSPTFNRRTSRCSPLSDRRGPPRNFSSPDRHGPSRNISPYDRQGQPRNLSPDRRGQPRNFSPDRRGQARNFGPLPITHGPPRNISPVPIHNRRIIPRSISPILNRPVHPRSRSPIRNKHMSPGRSISPIVERGGPLRNISPLHKRRGPQRSRSPIPSMHRRSASIEEQSRDMDYLARGTHQTINSYDRFQQHEKHMFADHVHDLSSSKVVKDKDFIGSSSLVQESLYMEDGTKRTFYTLPEVQKNLFDSTTVLNPSDIVRSSGRPIYEQLPRDPYNSTRPVIGTSMSSSNFANNTDMAKLYSAPLPNNGFNQASQVSDHLMKASVGPRDSYEEHARRERNSDNKSFSEFKGSMGRGVAYSLDMPNSMQRDTTMDFCDLKDDDRDYGGASSSGYIEYGVKELGKRLLPPIGERYHLERDMGPVDYKERHDSPLLVHRDMDMYRHDMDPPRQKLMMEIDGYDFPHERMFRGEYIISNELEGRSVHRRIRSPIQGDDEMWVHENHEHIEPRNVFRRIGSPTHSDEDGMWSHDEHRPIDERRRYASPRRTDFRQSRIASRLENDRKLSIKKRLRPAPFIPENTQEFFEPQKYWKQGLEDGNYNNINSHNEKIHVKNDPPEDSDEFKLQVHKAFLRFSKLLNESWHQKKKFKDDDQRKSTNLLCPVCGRFSKEFSDVHSLLCHSYHSLKAGLRTEHMGFHKALCVLNGWDWLVIPDTSYAYKRRSPSEIKTLKDDLILWPPIVIILNCSIGHKCTNGPKVVSVEEMEGMLEGRGFDTGKIRIVRGRPADQSVLLVKFMATFSGLQEAEKLHKYYADKNKGREGYNQVKCSKTEVAFEKDEDVLYGYLAVAEDLDKLDPESKKRSLVKSRKDIDAIADAPID